MKPILTGCCAVAVMQNATVHAKSPAPNTTRFMWYLPSSPFCRLRSNKGGVRSALLIKATYFDQSNRITIIDTTSNVNRAAAIPGATKGPTRHAQLLLEWALGTSPRVRPARSDTRESAAAE